VIRWIKRIAAVLGCIIIVALLAGVAYEQIMRRQAAEQFPPPGRLVDVGGHRMQIDCRGSGSPTVVLEAGLDALGSLSWSAVHDAIAKHGRACAYSRAGLVWSEPRSEKFQPDGVARDLHGLLANAGEHPPFVMVGHSLGGPYIMTFTRLYPQDVAGLVFVDASHPDQIERIKEAIGKSLSSGDGLLKVAVALSWTGVPRIFASRSEASGMPAHVKAVQDAYISRSAGALLDEADSLESTLSSAGQLRELGERPIVVLTAVKPFPETALKAMQLTVAQGQEIQRVWKQMHDDEASWSHHSRREIVADSSHYIQFDRPDVVIAAVSDVVDQLRSAGTVPTQ
jgi:pimeloyl-ACP methyl ester carboxylesterase